MVRHGSEGMNERGDYLCYRNATHTGKPKPAPYLTLSEAGRIKAREVLTRYRAGEYDEDVTPVPTADRDVIKSTEVYLMTLASSTGEIDLLRLYRDLPGQIDPRANRWIGIVDLFIQVVTRSAE